MPSEIDSTPDFELPSEEPTERDFSVIWHSLPFPRLLLDRFNREVERFTKEGASSHTEARQLAKEKIEAELTEEEYQSILAEIHSRPPRDSMMPPPAMMDAKEADPVLPPEAH